MLDRLRFQEVKKAIFRVKNDTVLNGKQYHKGQPFLVVDNATVSSFVVHTNVQKAIDRGFAGGTGTIRSITFDLIEGRILLNVFGSLFGTTEKDAITYRTEMVNVTLDDDDIIVLPSFPADEKVIIYKYDYNGSSTLLRGDQYSLNGDTITLISKYTGDLLITYKEEASAFYRTTINQIGENMILDLEMQCTAFDIISGDKFDVLMTFKNVNTSVDFRIVFNKSDSPSMSTVHCEVLPEQLVEKGINKVLFDIAIL